MGKKFTKQLVEKMFGEEKKEIVIEPEDRIEYVEPVESLTLADNMVGNGPLGIMAKELDRRVLFNPQPFQSPTKLSLAQAIDIVGNNNLYESETYYILDDNRPIGSKLLFTFMKNYVTKLRYIIDYDGTIVSMGIKFRGTAVFMYGTYWESKKGSKCFIPKPLTDAEDVLIRIDWHKNHADQENVGIKEYEESIDVLYFHRTCNSGALTGSDYIILPKDYNKRIKDDEI